MNEQKQNAVVVDAVVVGAGVAGIYALFRLRSMGLSVRLIEAADQIGGTWHWNRYPGSRCDAQSMGYSYHFSQALENEWKWTHLYATQPEVLEYLEHVMDRFDLHDSMQLSTRVLSAQYDEVDQVWTLTTDRKAKFIARFCIMAVGCLSKEHIPEIPGRETFKGQAIHTGKWPKHAVSFENQRVGVIGTGTSGVQIIPEIAKSASHLWVFQRTPVYVIPSKNRPLDPTEVRRVKENLEAFRSLPLQGAVGFDFDSNSPSQPEELKHSPSDYLTKFEECWNQGGFRIFGAFKGLRGQILRNKEANDQVANFIRSKIRSTIKNPSTAEDLCPKFPILCKRAALSDHYYETYNRSNVTLINLQNERIDKFIPNGITTTQRDYDLDKVIYATGFDAMTGALLDINPLGRNGMRLADQWHEGPANYLGLAVHGFPNLFILNGPLSPGVLSNMIATSENQVNWIASCIAATNQRGKCSVEASEEAQKNWTRKAQELASGTLFPSVSSWYMGDNIRGKPRQFLMYLDTVGYPLECNRIAQSNFEGFLFN